MSQITGKYFGCENKVLAKNFMNKGVKKESKFTFFEPKWLEMKFYHKNTNSPKTS